MERYTEITIPELLDFISKKETKNIYFKAINGDIIPLDRDGMNIDGIHRLVWFKREVIE